MSDKVEVEKINGMDKWEVQSAVDTLIRAEEIKNDSKLLSAVKRLMEEKVKATSEAAAKLKVEQKTSKKLKKVFG